VTDTYINTCAPTRDQVLKTIADGLMSAKSVHLPREDITADLALWSSDDPDVPCVAMDSIDFLELVLFLEEKCGWTIPEKAIDIYECKTVGDLVQLVLDHAIRRHP